MPHNVERANEALAARTVMAPAVEIDPRLLRQLEEEYESLKNDTERESKSGQRRGRDAPRPFFHNFFFRLDFLQVPVVVVVVMTERGRCRLSNRPARPLTRS